jgi:hypothetical protein
MTESRLIIVKGIVEAGARITVMPNSILPFLMIQMVIFILKFRTYAWSSSKPPKHNRQKYIQDLIV